MGNVVMEATQINYRRDDTLKTVDQKLQELSQESAIDTDIAPVFKSTDTYHAGDLVYYRNKLYVFNVDHTGAWAAGDATATNVSAAMTAALAGKADYADIAGAFSAETSYTAGDLVIYNGIIYRCTNDHTGDWDADDFSATTIGAELDAINSNLMGKLIATSSDTGTYSEKLDEIKSAYFNLSQAEKIHAYIIVANTTIYNVASWSNGTFTNVQLTSSNFEVAMINLGGENGVTYFYDGTSISNTSNTSNSKIFSLYVY